MIDNPIIFYTAVFFIVVFTILTLFAKNIINSLLASIVVFFSAAIFFYILGSEYNAIIQASIYGLAVPVIIGISIMFTTGKQQASDKGFTLKYLTVLSGGIFVLAFVYLVMISLVMLPETFRIMPLPQLNSFDVISAFAKGIFINYVWAFELVSILLTIVIAGISVFRGRRSV